jgi:hypothetical protein
MFKITSGRGFQLQFENGWTVSVQFGQFNYCDNQFPLEDLEQLFNTPPTGPPDTISSPNAEIAAWDTEGNWYRFDDDTLRGYVTPNEVLEFMNMIASFPTHGKNTILDQ